MNDTDFVCQSFTLLDMFLVSGVGITVGYLTALLRHLDELVKDLDGE